MQWATCVYIWVCAHLIFVYENKLMVHFQWDPEGRCNFSPECTVKSECMDDVGHELYNSGWIKQWILGHSSKFMFSRYCIENQCLQCRDWWSSSGIPDQIIRMSPMFMEKFSLEPAILYNIVELSSVNQAGANGPLPVCKLPKVLKRVCRERQHR